MFNMPGWKPVKTYNGKTGCMCGCNGTYNEDPSSVAFKRRVAKVMDKKFVGPVRPEGANMSDVRSYSTEPFGDERYMYVEQDGRNTTVYFVKA